MTQLKLYQVDAFTNELFKGNPAAVCLLDEWLPDEVMQNIAAENNLAETAFLVSKGDHHEIRWFTPTVEVDLCGHATLASGHVLMQHEGHAETIVNFRSPRSGELSVQKENASYTLDFPADDFSPTALPAALEQSVNATLTETYKGKTDYLLVVGTQSELEAIEPDFALMNTVAARGVIVTAPGNTCDFVSRFFAPQSGINEDPVTGSAHTTLTPYWSVRLNKQRLTAQQLSQRGGQLQCEQKGDRVLISGAARTYLVGTINID